jgi:hypothetical protein
MIKQLTILFLLISSSLFSQTELNLDNNLTGVYSETKNGPQFGLNFAGNNSLDINKFSLDLGTNYQLGYLQKSLTQNEFIQRANLAYNHEYWDVFTTYQYNYSLIRQIESDNWIGIGGGVKKKFSWGKLSLSYATLYQSTNYTGIESTGQLRHSLRAKIKIDKTRIGLSMEYYYQPSMSNFNDYIVYGITKIIINPKKPVSFIIQDVLNYRTDSEFKLLHNINFGISYKFVKKVEKKSEK